MPSSHRPLLVSSPVSSLENIGSDIVITGHRRPRSSSVELIEDLPLAQRLKRDIELPPVLFDNQVRSDLPNSHLLDLDKPYTLLLFLVS
jgi:hypothetical protein